MDWQRRITLLKRTLLAALLIAIAAWTAAGCGGDDEPDSPTPPDGIDVTDELPDDWPDDFPIYPDATLDSFARSTEAGAEGDVATFTTADPVVDVTDFYIAELEDGPWVTSGEPLLVEDSSLFDVETADGERAGSSITIAAADEDLTEIIIILVDEP